jgi:hypothetical protein
VCCNSEHRVSLRVQTHFRKYDSVSYSCGADTVHRPGDGPRKECEECGNARGSNVRYYPT